MNTPPLTLFYDGLCPLCSREIEHYKKCDANGNLAFVDITDPSFDPKAHGVEANAVHRSMHVKLPGGELRTGVDAFLAIWGAIPRYRWLARFVRTPGVRQLAWMAYAVFARVRPFLPRRKRDCAGGVCRR